jgi:hypothetical protein
MGYVHDVSLSLPLPASAGQRVGGTWTVTREACGQIELVKGFAADTVYLVLVIPLPASAQVKRGVRLASVDIYYEVKAVELADVTSVIELLDLPADGEAMPAVTLVAKTVTAADVIAVDCHTYNVAPDEDLWLSAGQVCRVVLTVESDVASSLYFYGYRINYVFRE